MAKRGSKKKASKKGRRTTKRARIRQGPMVGPKISKKLLSQRRAHAAKTKGHVPLDLLEKRLVKLNRTVKSRGGAAFAG